MQHNDYDITSALKAIEDELIASMIRNMKRHRAEETKQGIEWSMWQAEQLKALEKYKRDNQKKYRKQFKSINAQITALIQQARDEGNMKQEIRILQAIKKRLEGAWEKQLACASGNDGRIFQAQRPEAGGSHRGDHSRYGKGGDRGLTDGGRPVPEDHF